MSLWEGVAGLELRIDGYRLERRESQTPSGWTRVTTTVVMDGDGEIGSGEDVTYDSALHDDVPDELMFAGTWSLEDLSHRLDEFPELDEGYRDLPAGTELTTDYRIICDAVRKRGTIY